MSIWDTFFSCCSKNNLKHIPSSSGYIVIMFNLQKNIISILTRSTAAICAARYRLMQSVIGTEPHGWTDNTESKKTQLNMGRSN